jgi:hypothetical protein
MYDAEELVLSLSENFMLLKLVGDFENKLVAFQQHVIRLCKTYNCILSQTENASGTAVYFDMSSNYTVNDSEENHGTGSIGQ